MTVHEIVRKHLEENGFDGLWFGDCGCPTYELAPCGEPNFACSAGYRFDTPEGGIICSAEERDRLKEAQREE